MGALDMGLAPGVLPGRVGLDEGRDWFRSAWGSVPEERGEGTSGILADLAAGTMKALVLLGADPLGDFPDFKLAEEALEKADFVVAVESFLSPSSECADVVLPAATAHERHGTTTNIEGRVTRLGQKLVPPGQSRPDWMIAAELAVLLGGDLGFTSVGEIWDEIERVAPSHAGITRSVLDRPGARDGIVAPLAATPVSLATKGSASRFDPMATPGIVSVEVQGAPLRAGHATWGNGADGGDASADPRNGGGGRGGSLAEAPARPKLIGWPQTFEAVHVPPADSYSLRLVAPRLLYDDGVTIAACDSLTALAPSATARVNKHDLDRLGVTTGQKVRLRSSRASLEIEVVGDESIPRATAVVGFNLDAGDVPGAASLIDAAQPVVDVRMETL